MQNTTNRRKTFKGSILKCRFSETFELIYYSCFPNREQIKHFWPAGNNIKVLFKSSRSLVNISSIGIFGSGKNWMKKMMLHNPNRFPDLIPLAKDWAQLIVLIIGRNNHPSRSASNINIQRWENTLSCTQYYLFLCSIFLPQTLIYIFNYFMHSYIFKNIPDDWRGLHPNKKFATKFVNLNSTPAELVPHIGSATSGV